MTTGIFNCAAIREYSERVRAAPVLVGREQIALIEWLEILDGKETIRPSAKQSSKSSGKPPPRRRGPLRWACCYALVLELTSTPRWV